ncbi:MAG: type II toxin-antitoxin system RelB/DinJ family antitoxin [Chitinivibrionales bacterium]|nr:type II toxin-antitoxin system RelB/DinJ family antitoxin [Chitinivibrionales bacterium]
MAGKTTIQIRVDEDLKKEAADVFRKMHMTLSQAIKLFLGQAVSKGGIGIELRTPSKELQERMDAVERGEGMMEFDTVEELFEELDRR